jgi:uncharacterized protein (DUF2336 family)
MIVRHFLSWVRTASAGERAEATRALARAFLFSDLTDHDRGAAEGALLMMLDDGSPLVRQAMAEVFANALDAPPEIVRALAGDQFAIAAPLLERSPLLMDADLVDIVATGSCEVQRAIARRPQLTAPVSAAIAEVGQATACLELIGNRDAEIATMSLDRIVERFGHVADIREALLASDFLPASTRLKLVEKVSSVLVGFVTGQRWLSQERAALVADEACERSRVNIAATSEGGDLANLVGHLRLSGELTPGLLLRSLLSGRVELLHAALVELTGLPEKRIAGILSERAGSGLNALLARAGFPASMLAAFRAALNAVHEVGFVDSYDGMARLRSRMVERVLTSCQHDEAASEALLTMLRRYATESAREEARRYCDELVAEDQIATIDVTPIAA